MSGVTQFWNAMHIINNTDSVVSYNIQVNGYKQLFSTSQDKRNVPNAQTSDNFEVSIAPKSGMALGAGIFRNGSFDQSTHVQIGSLGTLTFNGTATIHGEDISQAIQWSGAPNVNYSTSAIWNFNHPGDLVVTVTIN
jgi:hypothetical protein